MGTLQTERRFEREAVCVSVFALVFVLLLALVFVIVRVPLHSVACQLTIFHQHQTTENDVL